VDYVPWCLGCYAFDGTTPCTTSMRPCADAPGLYPHPMEVKESSYTLTWVYLLYGTSTTSPNGGGWLDQLPNCAHSTGYPGSAGKLEQHMSVR
jgi:hypothetical protein